MRKGSYWKTSRWSPRAGISGDASCEGWPCITFANRASGLWMLGRGVAAGEYTRRQMGMLEGVGKGAEEWKEKGKGGTGSWTWREKC